MPTSVGPRGRPATVERERLFARDWRHALGAFLIAETFGMIHGLRWHGLWPGELLYGAAFALVAFPLFRWVVRR